MKKINKLIKETYDLQQQIKVLEDKVAENKQVIQSYFDTKNNKIDNNSIIADNVKATKVSNVYITYNGFQLEKKLKENDKKKLLNKIIKKTYSIINIDAFIDLMKLTHLSPYTVKSHIRVDRKVDSDAVKRLFERGELTKEDLDGCFEHKIVDYVKLTEIKTSEGD